MSWDLLSVETGAGEVIPFTKTAFVASMVAESKFQKLIQAAI